jgi:hypothetical protein
MGLASLGISTGDILTGGFGNHGVSGGELANIFGSISEAEALQAAQEREQKAQRTKLIVISGGVIVTLSFIIILYYLTSQKPKT